VREAIDNARLCGAPPRDIIRAHGGPGGAGEMAPPAAAIGGVQFELIEDCGHKPWHERRAKLPSCAALDRAPK
jgi:hypothetical protein